MEYGNPPYAFDQDRSAESIEAINRAFSVIDACFRELRPYFLQAGLEVDNCTPRSRMTAFPYVPFDSAIQAAIARMPQRIDTSGMYDRRQREVAARNAAESARIAALRWPQDSKP
jgi:hypothetical protein